MSDGMPLGECRIITGQSTGKMTAFSISNSNSVTLTDTSPGTGAVIDFTRLDNSFSIQINGVDLFVGGPAGAPNMAEFQIARTSGQTVRFADGDQYALDTPEVYQLSNTGSAPVVRLAHMLRSV